MGKGIVYLVGAGPGDYKLMTLRGLECIKKSDVIVYDRLANNHLLSFAKENCEFIYVGKASSNHTLPQDEINEVIAQKAKNGKIVTRLKGGDPYVFGRGGEEGEYLLERDIDFEVVPGVTSAIGGLCYAGIPITHRDLASSFHIITGHLKEEDKNLDFNSLSKLNGTLVFLMGMSNLENICASLIKEGKKKDTPVAIVNWATRYNQKVVTGNLETIVQIVKDANIKPPSIIVVGDVVSLRDKLNFFEKKPLFGKNIVVTRARSQSSGLVEKILDMGGNPIECPTIKIDEIENNEEIISAINDLDKYNYLIFTSQNGVDIFFDKLMKLDKDIRCIKQKIVAIGPATADALKSKGIIADFMPTKYVAEGIYDLLKDKLTDKDSILIPRAKESRDFLVDKLSSICTVKEVHIYKTIVDDSTDIDDLLKKSKINYITFTSSSTVKNFVKLVGENNLDIIKKSKIISIGPITSSTITSYGLSVYKECENYTIDEILKNMIND